jgi:hypothetical protein
MKKLHDRYQSTLFMRLFSWYGPYRGKRNQILDPSRSVPRVGEVEMHLGPPTTSSTLENGMRVDIYEYELGNEPSAGRAIAHGVMDILTLGLWEIVGTPIEAFQGEKRQITITYDNNDCVKSITGTAPKRQF